MSGELWRIQARLKTVTRAWTRVKYCDFIDPENAPDLVKKLLQESSICASRRISASLE